MHVTNSMSMMPLSLPFGIIPVSIMHTTKAICLIRSRARASLLLLTEKEICVIAAWTAPPPLPLVPGRLVTTYTTTRVLQFSLTRTHQAGPSYTRRGGRAHARQDDDEDGRGSVDCCAGNGRTNHRLARQGRETCRRIGQATDDRVESGRSIGG
jgi:hypothetical protein